jgi:hypothetical protein
MKKVLLALFFFAGLAATQLSAQSGCAPNCQPNPACCKPTPACCTAAKGSASATPAAKPEATVACTPEQLKQCAAGSASTNAPAAAANKQQSVAIRQED